MGKTSWKWQGKESQKQGGNGEGVWLPQKNEGEMAQTNWPTHGLGNKNLVRAKMIKGKAAV